MSDVICSLAGQPRRTHMPPQTLFEEKLLTLLTAERARTLYYEEHARNCTVPPRFEYAEAATRDRFYQDARVLLESSL